MYCIKVATESEVQKAVPLSEKIGLSKVLKLYLKLSKQIN